MARNLRSGLRSSLKPTIAGGFAANDLFTTASLDLNFAKQKNVGNLVTFTRASNGTYVDSQGVIRTAVTNEARFDHNPTTGESLGLLVEEARTNVVTWSQDFSQTDWTKAASTVVSTAVASPIQGVNYQKIEATSANTTVGVTSIAVTAATQQRAVSFFAQPLGNISRVLVVIQGIDARINVNLVDGTFTTNAIAKGSTVSVSGQRFSVSTPTLTLATGVRFFLKRTGETELIIPTTIAIGEGLYLTGAQMEAGAFPTSYIPTTTAAATRAADVASITGSNFSSWYRQDEGTVFASATNRETYPGFNIFPYLAQIDNGTNDNRASLDFSVLANGYRYNLALRNNNVPQFEIGPFGIAQNSAQWAVGLKSGDFASTVSVVPGSVFTNTTGTLPNVMTQLRIGAGFGKQFNGTIRRLCFWPARLGNEVLQRITQ